MSTIRDVLQNKGSGVVSVAPDDTVFDVIALMSDKNIGAVLVRDNDNLSGIFTERDYLNKIALQNRSSRDTAVRDVMSSPVITAAPDETIDQCMETMTNRRCRHIPVVENRELIGIVSLGDLVRQNLADKEAEIEQLNSYIAGSY